MKHLPLRLWLQKFGFSPAYQYWHSPTDINWAIFHHYYNSTICGASIDSSVDFGETPAHVTCAECGIVWDSICEVI